MAAGFSAAALPKPQPEMQPHHRRPPPKAEQPAASGACATTAPAVCASAPTRTQPVAGRIVPPAAKAKTLMAARSAPLLSDKMLAATRSAPTLTIGIHRPAPASPAIIPRLTNHHRPVRRMVEGSRAWHIAHRRWPGWPNPKWHVSGRPAPWHIDTDAVLDKTSPLVTGQTVRLRNEKVYDQEVPTSASSSHVLDGAAKPSQPTHRAPSSPTGSTLLPSASTEPRLVGPMATAPRHRLPPQLTPHQRQEFTQGSDTQNGTPSGTPSDTLSGAQSGVQHLVESSSAISSGGSERCLQHAHTHICSHACI